MNGLSNINIGIPLYDNYYYIDNIKWTPVNFALFVNRQEVVYKAVRLNEPLVRVVHSNEPN